MDGPLGQNNLQNFVGFIRVWEIWYFAFEIY